MTAAGVIEPAAVVSGCLTTAVETAVTLLRIDDILDVANFTEAKFHHSVLLSSTTFESNEMFREPTFTGPVELCNSLVERIDVNDRWKNLAVTDGVVRESAVVVRNVTCEGSVRFGDAKFNGDISIVASQIG